MMAISDACGVEKLRDDVKNAFLTTLTSLDLWPLDYDNPQACIISSLLKRIKYTSSLEPAATARPTPQASPSRVTIDGTASRPR